MLMHLINILNGGGGERGYKSALTEIFGKDYVKDLETLNKALQIASRKAPAAQPGVVGSAFTDIIRARLGQFTLAGRYLQQVEEFLQLLQTE